MDLERAVNSDPRRTLPSVDRLIQELRQRSPDLAEWALRVASRKVIAAARERIARGDSDQSSQVRNRGGDARATALATNSISISQLVEEAAVEARRVSMRHPRAVINATGILLHTNLGRAPLSEAAQAAVAEAARGYSNLELDLETGRRGSRLGALEAKLIALSGAEAAHVVNNNAAAVLLALNTLALGRSVVVSRGELVEIGGSFRVPAIMERAGVRLCEIGTTNRTHLADYAEAISAETALLLKVHRSNFEQHGFVAEPDVGELAALAASRNIPLVEDLGSGTLVDFGSNVLPEEAFAPARLALGVDVVCFSGDKLIGGPQAGILLGRSELIDAMRRNPLARALRVDKLTLAALDATLDVLLDPSRSDEIPVAAGLRVATSELERRAKRLLAELSPLFKSGFQIRLRESETPVGGGSLPEHRLSGWAVVIEGPGVSAMAARLREAPTPVLVRIHDDALWLDVRTLRDDEMSVLVEAFSFVLD
jgi:L-seryl-tRNA(Ser) seleniumtransferase